MTHYDPNIHHRRSIRLKGYDYASAGLYFVTICVQNREMMFGEINNGNMILNDAGRMVERWYYETENKFPDIVCLEMVVMPNHFHCIWQNTSSAAVAVPVGADLCVRPSSADLCVRPSSADLCVRPLIDDEHTLNEHTLGEHTLGEHTLGEHTLGEHTLGEHVGSPLARVVQWFKTMSTNEYIRGVKQLGWPPFDRRLWQRNYYEHIIRNQLAYNNIANYINNNPVRWDEDKFHKK
ncbi:MAG: hypothetical protein MJZ91_08290 [Bacteroidales bacterium]|nr:hypothetical protein [Bacteroidales bacterium]